MAKKDKLSKDVKKLNKAQRKLVKRGFDLSGPDFPGLDLAFLRQANATRSTSKKGFNHPLNVWSIAEWTNALCGEAGEAANIAKKLIRIRLKLRGNVKKNDKTVKALLKRLAKEVADVVVYADLTLASEGLDLSDAIREVFNEKSKEIGYKGRL